MTDATPDRSTPLTEDEEQSRACDWSDYRKNYGFAPHAGTYAAFLAGWKAHRDAVAAERKPTATRGALVTEDDGDPKPIADYLG